MIDFYCHIISILYDSILTVYLILGPTLEQKYVYDFILLFTTHLKMLTIGYLVLTMKLKKTEPNICQVLIGCDGSRSS